jgi:malonyl-CoA decarboxylase
MRKENRLNVSFLQELLNAVAEQGRALLPRALFGGPEDNVEELAKALISGRGEASGVAIARQLINRYQEITPEERRSFFRFLADSLQPSEHQVLAAATRYVNAPAQGTLTALQEAVESPRREFFHRLNLAPGATAAIVDMRRDLLRLLKDDPGLAIVDTDLRPLLQSWFNRGFLVLRRIDWQTPAAILEKIIAYEAVHEIRGWDDLRRRLDPVDRRCFAFFHPSLVDEPLIFVEVALMNDIPGAIAPLLEEPSREHTDDDEEPTTAAFYSISNCQDGLKGISFGNFLLKQVVEELAREKPTLKTFVTLSPAPHFARWLDRTLADDTQELVSPEARVALQALRDPGWPEAMERHDALKPALLGLAAHYFLDAKSADQRPVDPVARFHLGNGARLDRINWLGDPSEKGLREAHGLMVNYRYELKEIERNHEAYANEGVIAASKAVRALQKVPVKAKAPLTIVEPTVRVMRRLEPPEKIGKG